jgi:signal transduction histidine kinase
VGLLHLEQDVTETGNLEQQLNQRRNELRLLQEQLTRQNLQLEAANAELQRLDELKSQFVSIAAHELRSPLTAVVGYVELLLDEDFGPLNPRQREFVQNAQEAGERLLALTGDLLDVTRIETGRVDLVLQPTDLAGVIETVVTELRPRLEAKEQELVLDLDPDLPLALCDRVRTGQIIGNLLGNAIKYTPDGGRIAITVVLARQESHLEVSLADNGVGISAHDQEKLFDRFYRAESATLSGASGAGLGLHIARSLVELHGERIWVESAPGKGSTFFFTLPVAEQPA